MWLGTESGIAGVFKQVQEGQEALLSGLKQFLDTKPDVGALRKLLVKLGITEGIGEARAVELRERLEALQRVLAAVQGDIDLVLNPVEKTEVIRARMLEIENLVGKNFLTPKRQKEALKVIGYTVPKEDYAQAEQVLHAVLLDDHKFGQLTQVITNIMDKTEGQKPPLVGVLFESVTRSGSKKYPFSLTNLYEAMQDFGGKEQFFQFEVDPTLAKSLATKYQLLNRTGEKAVTVWSTDSIAGMRGWEPGAQINAQRSVLDWSYGADMDIVLALLLRHLADDKAVVLQKDEQATAPNFVHLSLVDAAGVPYQFGVDIPQRRFHFGFGKAGDGNVGMLTAFRVYP